MTTILENITLCSGCGACENACSLNCIDMLPDDEGFCYPSINLKKCIDCGKCRKSCPVLKPLDKESFAKKGYAVNALDDDVRFLSSSGGVFYSIAKNVLSQDGVVFGVSMSQDVSKAQYMQAQTMEQLLKLLGSKYVQADVGYAYRETEKVLKEGRYVLFSGLPCQISGLKKYLKKEYGNLICIDVICHGVPSPKLWRKYVDYINKKYGEIIAVSFRYKKYGWERFGTCIKNYRKKIFQTKDINPYMRLFLQDIALRESCYNCSFKGFDRDADITLGDFWGISNYVKEMSDGKGTSIVLVHSKKGEDILKKIHSEIIEKEVDYKLVFREHNDAMTKSVERPKEREHFFDDIDTIPFDSLAEKYSPLTNKKKVFAILEKMKMISILSKLGGGVSNRQLWHDDMGG